MAKVTLHHYNCVEGRKQNDADHFNITFMPKIDAVQRAWTAKLYNAIADTTARDEHDHLDICEKVFHDQNSDKPRNWRSMSVGDIVQIDTKYYLCDSLGFKEITLN